MTLTAYRWILPLLLLLSGCGGGGGGASLPPPPLAVLASSYANKNDIVLDLPQIPSSVLDNVVPDSVTFGDFFQEGSYSAFVVAPSATASGFQGHFLKKNGSVWTDATSTLLDVSQSDACPVVRQALTADFNGDGKPDVYLVCGGGASVPQVLYISQASPRKYQRQETTGINLQAWGASAADVDGDGRIDIVSSDSDFVVQLTNTGLSNGLPIWTKKTQNQMGITVTNGFPTKPRKVFLLPNLGGRPDLVVTGDGDLQNYNMAWLKNQAGVFNFNGNSNVSSIADYFVMPNELNHVTVFDLIFNSNYLYVLAKNATLEGSSFATKMVVLQYELPVNNPSNSQLSLLSSPPLKTFDIQSGGFVNQIKQNSRGQFVAYDGRCVSGEQRCDFAITAP